MILISTEVENNTIILTLDGRDFAPVLFIKHDATQAPFTIPLDEYDPEHTSRYDLFKVPTGHFTQLPKGYYQYEIKELVTGLTIESGKLYIPPVIVTEIEILPGKGETLIILN